MPRTFGGTAEKRNPSSGRPPRLAICSQIGIPAASSFECTGRERVRVSGEASLVEPLFAARAVMV